MHAEFEGFHFVTVYTPNSSSGLKRLPFRKQWDQAFKAYLMALDATKPVICCGDLNVAHQPIDLARPDANYNKTPGYTQDEIDGLTDIEHCREAAVLFHVLVEVAGIRGQYHPAAPGGHAYALQAARVAANAVHAQARRDLGILPQEILHVAQSLTHDMVPATQMGMTKVWINRRHGQEGLGATAPPQGDYTIEWEFPGMAEFVEAHRQDQG